MMLSEEDRELLVLCVSGMADPDTVRQGEQLLADSAEARAYADSIRRITAALGPGPEDLAAMPDAELEPWMRLARARIGSAEGSPVHPPRHKYLRRALWLVSAVAASLLVAVGVWRFRATGTPTGPGLTPPTAPIGRLWQSPEVGSAAARDTLTQDLHDNRTIKLERDRFGKIVLGDAAIWLAQGSELSLSNGEKVIEVTKGALVLEVPNDGRTWRVRLSSIEAEMRSGILQVDNAGSTSDWQCYRGEMRLRLKSTDVNIKAGEGVTVDGQGNLIRREPLRRQSSSLRKQVEQSFKTFVPDANKAPSSR
jgi:hypothetical protein